MPVQIEKVGLVMVAYWTGTATVADMDKAMQVLKQFHTEKKEKLVGISILDKNISRPERGVMDRMLDSQAELDSYQRMTSIVFLNKGIFASMLRFFIGLKSHNPQSVLEALRIAEKTGPIGSTPELVIAHLRTRKIPVE